MRAAAARGLAAAAVLALLVAAALASPAGAAAGAQSGGGAAREPVVGGGSFATAPLVEPGRYRDTILPGERLYYGIRLEAGQRLRVTAEAEEPAGAVPNETAQFFYVGLQTPLREVVVGTEEDRAGNGTFADPGDRLDIVYPEVLAASGARNDPGGYDGPGVWYPSIYLSSSQLEPARVEYPFEFELEVIGEPQPDASPEPTAAEPAPAATPAPAEDGGPPVAAVAGVGLAGLLVGLLGGGLLARRS